MRNKSKRQHFWMGGSKSHKYSSEISFEGTGTTLTTALNGTCKHGRVVSLHLCWWILMDCLIEITAWETLVRCLPRARLHEEGVWICRWGNFCCQLEKELDFLTDGCETQDHGHGLDRDTCSEKSCGDCDNSTTSLWPLTNSQSRALWKTFSGETFVWLKMW